MRAFEIRMALIDAIDQTCDDRKDSAKHRAALKTEIAAEPRTEWEWWLGYFKSQQIARAHGPPPRNRLPREIAP